MVLQVVDINRLLENLSKPTWIWKSVPTPIIKKDLDLVKKRKKHKK